MKKGQAITKTQKKEKKPNMATNYYEELKLGENESIEQINKKLDKLEATWKKREITNPEKATKMLALVIDARKVFKSEKTKSRYDKKLKSGENPEPDDKMDELEKMLEKVHGFRNDQMWDLAKAQYDKILSQIKIDDFPDDLKEDALICGMEIYSENSEFGKAMDLANTAILDEPDMLTNYSNKRLVLGKYIDHLLAENKDAQTQIENYRATCKTWLSKSIEQNNDEMKAMALYCSAMGYTFYPPYDYLIADEYAHDALSIEPDNESIKNLVDYIDKPKVASVDELEQYSRERSTLETQINSLVTSILERGLKPDNGYGWVIADKMFRGHYNPNNDGFDEECTTSFVYYLNESGEFIKERISIERYWGNGLPWKSSDKDKTVCSLGELMLETDFECNYYFDNGDAATLQESGNYVGYYSSFVNRGNIEIIRLCKEKGQMLAKALNEILEGKYEPRIVCSNINVMATNNVRIAESDIRNSFIFGRLHDMGPVMRNATTSYNGLANIITIMFSGDCKKYAEDHPDFAEAEKMKELSAAHSAENYEKFANIVKEVIPVLAEKAEKEGNLDAMALVANVEIIKGETESGNRILRRIFAENLKSKSLTKNGEQYWINAAIGSDFEEWLKQREDIGFTGDSKFNNKNRDGKPIQNGNTNGFGIKKYVLIAVAVIFGICVLTSLMRGGSSNTYYYDEDTESEYSEYYDEDYQDEYSENSENGDSEYIVGESYKVQDVLRVREGPGKNYRQLSRSELTSEDYAKSEDYPDALLKKGSTITCQEMSGNWMRISSGWVCVMDGGERLVE